MRPILIVLNFVLGLVVLSGGMVALVRYYKYGSKKSVSKSEAFSGLKNELKQNSRFLTSLMLSVVVISLFPNPLARFGDALIIVSGIESIFYIFMFKNKYYLKQALIVVLSLAYCFI